MDTRVIRPTKAEVDKIENGALYSLVTRVVESAVSFHEDEATYRRGICLVSEPQAKVWAAGWCQTEVRNGGFHQFFANSTGMVAPEAALGFDLILVPAAARLAREVMAKFPVPFPRDREEALRAIEGEGEERKDWDPFSSMDDRFSEVTGTRAFDAQAAEFIRKNLELFFLPPHSLR